MSVLFETLHNILFPAPALVNAKNKKILQEGGGPNDTYSVHFWYIIHLAVSIFAVYLSWNCNINETLPIRILYAIFAFICSFGYIIFYLVYRILMGNECSGVTVLKNSAKALSA